MKLVLITHDNAKNIVKFLAGQLTSLTFLCKF